MTVETKYCEKCRYFDGTKAVEDLPPCEKGHKPRFYKPDPVLGIKWKWKRKCEDFKKASYE